MKINKWDDINLQYMEKLTQYAIAFIKNNNSSTDELLSLKAVFALLYELEEQVNNILTDEYLKRWLQEENVNLLATNESIAHTVQQWWVEKIRHWYEVNQRDILFELQQIEAIKLIKNECLRVLNGYENIQHDEDTLEKLGYQIDDWYRDLKKPEGFQVEGYVWIFERRDDGTGVFMVEAIATNNVGDKETCCGYIEYNSDSQQWEWQTEEFTGTFIREII